MVSDEGLEKALNFIRDEAKKYAQAKAARVQLMEFRKSKKAILMKNAQVAGHKTGSAQEREAYADPEYIDLLNAIREAVEVEELIRYQMKAAELKIEIWRSKNANRRNEQSRYGA